MVLAKLAAQIAVTEKDVADACCAADYRFLAPVQGDGGDGITGAGAAEAGGPGKAVNTTLPGAEAAGMQGKRRCWKGGCWGHEGFFKD